MTMGPVIADMNVNTNSDIGGDTDTDTLDSTDCERHTCHCKGLAAPCLPIRKHRRRKSVPMEDST